MKNREYKDKLILIREKLLQTIRDEYQYPVFNRSKLIRNVYAHELIKDAFKKELGDE